MDHVVPVKDAPDRDEENWNGLCREHHALKTAMENPKETPQQLAWREEAGRVWRMSLADKITSDIKSLLISGSQVRVLLRSPMKSIGYMGFSQRVENISHHPPLPWANFSPPFLVTKTPPVAYA